MLGTFCKNFRHLKKSVENSPSKEIKIIVFLRNPEICQVIECENKIIIFNHFKSNVRSFDYFSNKSQKMISEMAHKYGSVIVLDTDGNNYEWFQHVINASPIVILPNNFDENYAKFVKNNNKQYKQLLDKHGIDINHSIALNLYCMCGDSINFMGWACKNVISNRIPFHTIFYIMQWNEKYSQFANKLKKGTITAYNGYSAINALIRELNEIRKAKRVNDSINEFNTAQKKILKNNVSDVILQESLNRFSKLSNTKKNNFIRKMSTIEDYGEILKQMKHLCEIHFEWDRNSFLDYITDNDSIKCNIILDRDNFILVTSQNYDTIKRLAKTTNWCISKNKRYWNDYVERYENAVQYILFDFNKKEDDDQSIVGFTINGAQGITHAHSFSNNNLMGDQKNGVLIPFTPTISCKDIYSILEAKNIGMDILFSGIKYPFEYNAESVLNLLTKYVHSEDIVILKNEDNKLSISIKDYNIVRIFDENVIENFETSLFERECILFFDFNAKNRNIFGISFINQNRNGEEYGSNIFDFNLTDTNINFNGKLNEFNMPYNTIRRICSPVSLFKNAMSSLDVQTLKTVLSSKENCEILYEKKKEITDYFYTLQDSIFTIKSKQLLDVFIDNDVDLVELFSIEHVASLVRGLCDSIVNRFDSLKRIPTQEDYDGIFNHINQNSAQCHYIGYFSCLNSLINNPKVIEIIGKDIEIFSSEKTLMKHFCRIVLDNINTIHSITSKRQILVNISVICINFGIHDMLCEIMSITNDNDLLSYIKGRVPSLATINA